MKVVFFTEGGKEIGLGHVSRCAALAEGLRHRFHGAEIHFALRGDETALEFLKIHGFPGEFFDWEKDLPRSGALLSGAEVAVVDSYLAGEDFYHFVAERVERFLVFDDFFRLSYPDKAFVLNPTAEPDGHPRHLFGLEYVVLRPPFWEVPEVKVRREVRRILITLGGEDRWRLSATAARIAHRIWPEKECVVVLGPASEGNGRIPGHIFRNLSARKMRDLMLSCDTAISAGGQTIYELARVGLPAVGIKTGRDQENNFERFGRRTVLYAGSHANSDLEERLERRLKGLVPRLSEMSRRGPEMVDGKGVFRVWKKVVEG